ncbi:NUMOD4 domain-containing protein [Bacillus pacificus]|uniref:NUMOD4 domain-containing protein n=1 Tax=Bacillus pacificus TaxID=2026187 RepID=UPI00397DCF69
MKKKEIWKSLEGIIEGGQSYQVSNFGTVKSIDRITPHGHNRRGKILKPTSNKDGYKLVILCNEGKTKSYTVHRLVALAFIENPEGKEQINHINGLKDDNKVENLEWVTQSENQKHAFGKGLNKAKQGIDHRKAKLTEDDVKWIRENYIKGHREYSLNALSKKFGVNETTIRDVIHFKTWKHI